MMNKGWLFHFEKITIYLLLFLLPTQLAYHVWPSWSFVYGLRIDLLAPAVYTTDILVLVLIILNLNIFKDFKKYFLIVLIFAAVNISFSISRPESTYKWIKIFEMLFLGFYFSKQKFVEFSKIIKTFFVSLVLFSLIGIVQFLLSRTTNLFYLLGERTFNMTTPGMALVSLNGTEHLRAYSTFSHPNSLAGYLGALITFILLSGHLKRSIFNILGVGIVLVCLLFTFSVSAYLGIFLVFSLYLFSKKISTFPKIIHLLLLISVVASLFLPIFSDNLIKNFPMLRINISQRLELAFISGKIISQNFWLGSGLGTFIFGIPVYKSLSYFWLLQPVHNIFLLIFSELGILGILGVAYTIHKILTNSLKNHYLMYILPFIFIIFTGLSDHYWLTLQQNILLLSILSGLSFKISSSLNNFI